MCSFLATLLLGVQTGVLVAMGFSLLLFVSKSSRPRITELGRVFGALTLSLLHRVIAAGVVPLAVRRGDVVICPNTNPSSGTVGYDELGNHGVSRVLEVKILRFGAPLFFANIGILKVSVSGRVIVSVRTTCVQWSVTLMTTVMWAGP